MTEAPRCVDYFFAPMSPWTYLGHARFAALLRETGTRRYILLVLARDSLTFRLVSRLTGEDSYLRRDCQQMLNRLLPRIRLDLVPVVMSAGDARLVFCSQASQLRLSALL